MRDPMSNKFVCFLVHILNSTSSIYQSTSLNCIILYRTIRQRPIRLVCLFKLHYHQGVRWLQGAQQRAHRSDTEKLACEDRRPFFFLFLRSHQNPEKTVAFFLEDLFLDVTSKFGQNCGIFSVCFGVHKTVNPSYLSWPRAHVRLSAPLTTLHFFTVFYHMNN